MIFGTAVPSAGVRVQAGVARALVRSPADVWFYSGHGSRNGALVIGPPFDPWMTPETLAAKWKGSSSGDLRVVIINGCYVLTRTRIGNAPSPAFRWSQLLRVRGGPLDCILGYDDLAPKDVVPSLTGQPRGGGFVAREIAKYIAQTELKGDLAKKWIDINVKEGWWNAVALTNLNYVDYDRTKGNESHPLPES